MNDKTRLFMLEEAKDLMNKSNDVEDLEIKEVLMHASVLLDEAAVGDCECKPGYPVCQACIDLARLLYGDSIPFGGEL